MFRVVTFLVLLAILGGSAGAAEPQPPAPPREGCRVLVEAVENCLQSARISGCEMDTHPLGGRYEWMCVTRRPQLDAGCRKDATGGYAFAYTTVWYLCEP